MKTFSQFITEAKEAKPPEKYLDKLSRAYGRKYRGVNVDVSHKKSGDFRVNQLWVPPNMQGKGIGTEIMNNLKNLANKKKKRITLNQDPDKGREEDLDNFYKKHGFVPNSGDSTTKDTHIRNPQVSESKARQDIESSRYEDDVYRTTQQKLANPRLRRLRILLNRELGRHTV